jgi:predicted Rossmann fold nucleotide-binding protein DprA/Smf involved in DNA uptake
MKQTDAAADKSPKECACWVAVSGSWRNPSEKLLEDVHREVSKALQRGQKIISGGALGIDYVATQLALQKAPGGSRLKVILPSTLDVYSAHYRYRAEEGVIAVKEAEMLIRQLDEVKRAGSLVEGQAKQVNKESYYARNTRVLEEACLLLAFQMNASAGTQDTIDKARLQGIPVVLHSDSD